MSGESLRVWSPPAEMKATFYVRGRHSWDGAGDYNEEKHCWTFTYQPSAEELEKAAPEAPRWAISEVTGKLTWHLILRLGDCPRTLDEEFYPGVFSWESAGQVRRAVVPEGQAGWGDPRKHPYLYRGTIEYNSRNPENPKPRVGFSLPAAPLI